MSRRRLALIFALGCGLAIPPLQADEDSPVEAAIKYRQSAMKLVGANFKPMGAMLKGELPMDQAAFARFGKDLAAIAGIDILRGFPPDSEGADSKAKADIWLNWDDFRQQMEGFQAEAAKLGAVAAGGDPAAIKEQFGATGKTCKGCHDDYKE